MKAVIYARYSSDNQREESIEGQLRECKEYAERNGSELKVMGKNKVSRMQGLSSPSRRRWIMRTFSFSFS